MKNSIKNISLCAALLCGGVMVSSCDDFLTITPTSSIVEEEFWQDKNDLNNAVMGCYKQFAGDEMLNAYMNWGELRSDNVERSTETTATSQIANIMNANLLPTYGQFDWAPAYRCINSCNKVLAHGPEVIVNDESFSEANWKPIKAEIVTLRALAHFLLVRTFGEIPYVTQDYNNDSQDLKLGQTTQLAVLDSIINDLESIENDAILDYGNTVQNKGRITKKAVYSLLADVYLWRASYKAGNNQPFKKVILASNYAGALSMSQLSNRIETYSTTAEADYKKCIDYCDRVINLAKDEYIKDMNDRGENIGGDLKFELGDLLVQNEAKSNGFHSSSKPAYDVIFGNCNSKESVFELQFEGISYGNSIIGWDAQHKGYFLRTDEGLGMLTGALPLLEGRAEVNDPAPTSLFTKTDMRYWENIYYLSGSQDSYPLAKFTNESVKQSVQNFTFVTDNTKNFPQQSLRSGSNRDANFPIYRISDIFLMKAEAISQVYNTSDELKEGFNYVREVFKRSNPYAYSTRNPAAATDSLMFDKNFDQQESLEALIMTERQREFMCEGKRWFDLVRFAQRKGNTSKMLELLCRKYATNRKAIQSKLADIQSLFSPVFNDDIKANSLLYQNGVWSLNETTAKTDNM